jgi:FG-GAP-like repeat/Kelch motif
VGTTGWAEKEERMSKGRRISQSVVGAFRGFSAGTLGHVFALAFLLAAVTAAADTGRDRWSPTNQTEAPEARWGQVAVWTGSRMIVWGGSGEEGSPVTGSLYDPAGDTWTPIGTPADLQPCDSCTAVWTGTEMLVWGPVSEGDSGVGQVYNPATDTWRFTTAEGAPTARRAHAAVWTGTKMLVWGGFTWGNWYTRIVTSTGGVYDPASDSWTATNDTGAPSARYEHTAVWTGSKMIVWGGLRLVGPYTAVPTNTGALYDPATDAWTPMSTTGAPSARHGQTAVWTGSKMIVWGGQDEAGGLLNTGASYDPRTDTWTPMRTTGAPSARDSHTAVWTGSRMIVWGGGQASATEARDMKSNPGVDGAIGSGAIYDPVQDAWSPMSGLMEPSPRDSHSALWTGSEVIVWGGVDSRGEPLDTGGRYAPASVGQSDFNGDGKPDILWRHQTTGLLYVWLMDGPRRASGTFLTPAAVDPAWRVGGIADLNGDGKPDILWRHQTTGQLYVWLMDGTTQSSGAFLTPPRVDPAWQIQGLADFNGDGKPDILWRHQTTGQLYVWFMDGTTQSSGAFLTPSAVVDAAWQVRGLADFDADGKVDILWHNTTSGQLYVWLMNGTAQASGTFLSPSSVANTSWRVAELADFDGDGKADLLWRNASTGQLYLWLMDGTTMRSGTSLFPPSADTLAWQIAPR